MRHANNRIEVKGRGFFAAGPVCFYGHPGSARASAMASILATLRKSGLEGYKLICADIWTVGKSEQLRIFANALGCRYKAVALPADPKAIEVNRPGFAGESAN